MLKMKPYCKVLSLRFIVNCSLCSNSCMIFYKGCIKQAILEGADLSEA